MSSRPPTATIVTTRSAQRSARNESAGNGNARPSTAAASTKKRPSIFDRSQHSPPRFDMGGAQLPLGKFSGLTTQKGPILSLSGKSFVPQHWSSKPKHKTKRALLEHRQRQDKRLQAPLQEALDRKFRTSMASNGRPSLKQTYDRILAGCVPLECTTRTQSELFRTRSEQHLSSISEKSRRQEELMANSPAKARNNIAIQPQQREWERHGPEIDKYESYIAPIGRDRELSRKTMWEPNENPTAGTFIRPIYRENPAHRTRSELKSQRSKAAIEVATAKINKSYEQWQAEAKRNEEITRKSHLSTHVSSTSTKSELLERRRQQIVDEAKILRTKEKEEMMRTRSLVTTAPAIIKGWWQDSDTVINPLTVLKKGSNLRLRSIAQRTVQPSNDPFKEYSTSIIRMKRDRKAEQKKSVEQAVVDRSGPDWSKGESHLPSRPAIPVKRWSDVVIEFAQADQKLDKQRMDKNSDGMEEGGSLGGGNVGPQLSISDTQPLYSSFAKDGIFREPVYGAKKKKVNGEASCLLQPLGGCSTSGVGGSRNLTLMQRSHRMARFRDAYADKIRQRTQMALQQGSLQHLSKSLVPGDMNSMHTLSRGGNSNRGLHSTGSNFEAISSDDQRRTFRDRGSTPPVGARRTMLKSRGAVSTASASLIEEQNSFENSARLMKEGDHPLGSRKLNPSQSMPALNPNSSSRASTAPSSRNRGSTNGHSGSLGMYDNKRSFSIRRQGEDLGSRPSTAPLRMRKRPGTAVRTRGFFDD